MNLFGQFTDLASSYFQESDHDSSSLREKIAQTSRYWILNRLIGLAVPFAYRNRFRVLVLQPGYLKARIRLRGNRNHMGTVYAGAQFLLAEIPGGVMALFEFGSDYFPTLKELKMQYLKPARTDLTVEFQLSARELARIRQKIERLGKADFQLKGELRDQAGDVVAHSTALYQVRAKSVERSQ